MAERPSRCEWLQRILGETLSCRHRLCHAILDLPRTIVEQHRIVLRPGRLDEALHRGIRLAPLRGTVAPDRRRTIKLRPPIRTPHHSLIPRPTHQALTFPPARLPRSPLHRFESTHPHP